MNNTTEIWKDIQGYERLYQVSNLGRDRSLNRYVKFSNGRLIYYKSKILKSIVRKDNYLIVDLHKNGDSKKFYVHRLVAEAFLDNPNNLPQVNHKDENRQNNNVDNLEWCSSEYNINYGNRTSKCTKQVYQFDMNNKLLAIYQSTIEVNKLFNYDCGLISKCCNGK